MIIRVLGLVALVLPLVALPTSVATAQSAPQPAHARSNTADPTTAKTTANASFGHRHSPDREGVVYGISAAGAKR